MFTKNLDDTVYLRHIIDAIAKIEKYTKGIDNKSFVENTLLQDGVIREIECTSAMSKRGENFISLPKEDFICHSMN